MILKQTTGSIAGAGRREVLRFPSLEKGLFLFAVVNPVIPNIIPDSPFQVIGIIPVKGNFRQMLEYLTAIFVFTALWKIR